MYSVVPQSLCRYTSATHIWMVTLIVCMSGLHGTYSKAGRSLKVPAEMFFNRLLFSRISLSTWATKSQPLAQDQTRLSWKTGNTERRRSLKCWRNRLASARNITWGSIAGNGGLRRPAWGAFPHKSWSRTHNHWNMFTATLKFADNAPSQLWDAFECTNSLDERKVVENTFRKWLDSSIAQNESSRYMSTCPQNTRELARGHIQKEVTTTHASGDFLILCLMRHHVVIVHRRACGKEKNHVGKRPMPTMHTQQHQK